MKSIKVGTLVSMFAFCGAVQAGPHSVTYSQVSVAPGTKVTIAGNEFVAAQVGIRQFTANNRYAVRWLVPSQPFGFAAALETEHNPAPLENPNATIDGFPAHIEIVDGRSYSLSGAEIPTPSSTLLVQGQAFALVRIQVGDTRLIIYGNLTQIDQQAEITTDIYRGTSQSTYDRYTDLTTLVGPSGLDKWVDYIRVIPLN
jgi:hypothetical protein